MEQPMKSQNVVTDVQRAIELVQAEEVVIIQAENGPELVLMTHEKFKELQGAGKAHPHSPVGPAPEAGKTHPHSPVGPAPEAGKTHPHSPIGPLPEAGEPDPH